MADIAFNIVTSLTNLTRDIDKIVASQSEIAKLVDLAKLFREAMDNDIRVFFTGVGKTSYAADKLAATAKSIGVKSEFLDCQNAGHGDIGALPDGKCFCIFMSKSGRTTEHFELARLISNRRPNCVNIMFCFADDDYAATIGKANCGMDNVINIHADNLESDNRGIVPTNSNALFEACISSALISAGMQDMIGMFKNLEKNHPSGSLHAKVTKYLNDHGVTIER